MNRKENCMINPDDMLNRALSVQIISDSRYFAEYNAALCVSLQKRNIDAIVCEQYDENKHADVVLFVGATIRELKQLRHIKKKGY